MNSWAPRGNRMTLPAWCSAANETVVSFQLSVLSERKTRHCSISWLSILGFKQKQRLAGTVVSELAHNHSMKPRELVNSICEMLQRNKHQALLVGGCVRDVLLGREPADYDVATDATPVELAGLFPESVAVGAKFGVILVPKDGMKV